MVFVRNKNLIEKYDVSVNINKLKELKKEIFYNASRIEHVKKTKLVDGFESTLDEFNEHNLNFKKRLVKKVGEDLGSPFAKIYEVEYDRIIDPPVLKIIDRALYGDSNSALLLLNYEPLNEVKEMEDANLDVKIKLQNAKTKEEYKEILEKLKRLKNVKRYCNESLYIDDLRKCVTLTKIGELSYKDYERVSNFIDEDVNMIDKNDIAYKKSFKKNRGL